jgi:putative transposon-encoded protein
MRKIPLNITNEIKVNNIEGYLEKKVTKFGTGAKVDIPKEYLGKKVVILVCKD